MEICDQFWIAMVAPKDCQAKIVKRKHLVCMRRGADVGANVLTRSIKSENKINDKLEPSKFPPLPHSGPMPQEIPQSSSEGTAIFVLRIHSRLGHEEPLNDRLVTVPGCEVQRCRASGAATKPQAEPNGTKGQKL